jgi:hypothetical protein
MTSSVGRLYAIAGAIAVFFCTWLLVAAAPWAPAPSDPRLAALAARDQRVRLESVVVRRVVKDRWATYQRQLAQLQSQAAAPPVAGPPAVRIVTLPPLTVTRSS